MKILLYKDFSDSKSVVEAECGKKIADAVPVTDWSRHVVLVNGIKSDENHVLKENDLVIIRSVPRGSDNPVVSTVLTIATGGIYAGYQAYQAKKEAEKIQDEIDKLKSHTNDGITNVPYIKGANNAIASGKSQPYVIGRHLLTPYVLNSSKSAAKGFHTIGGAYGAGTYYNVVLGCGFGKQIIDSLSTDDVKAAALSSDSPQENTEEFPKYFFNKGSAFASDESFVEISQDGNNFSNPIFNRKIVETSPNAQLKKSDAEDYEDLYFTLEKNARACSVCILFNGLYQQNDKGERSSREITIIPEYSIDYARRLALNDSPEEAGWIPFTFTQKSTATRKVLHTGSYRFDFDGPVNYGTTDYSRLIKKRKSEWILKSGEDCKDHPGVTYDFYYETEGHAVLGADIICSYYEEVEESVPATDSNTFSYNKNTQLRFEAYTPFSFSEATRLRVSGGKLVYEPRDYPITLRLRCTTPKVKSGSEVSDCYVEYVQSYCYDVEKSLKARRLIDERILEEKEASRSTLLGVHVKATASNEDKLGKINIVTNGLAPVCEYDSARHRWVWDLSEKVPTSNPASWLLEVLMSDTHPASKFRSEELDLDSFAELYGYCEEKGLSVNLVLAQPQKKSSVLDSILSVCHAALYQNIYGQCAVAIDCVKENAIAVLNEQNMISFSWEKQIALNVDGVRVTYIDEASDWQENSFIRMYNPDAEIGENSVIREIRADGITNFVQAQKHAHYIMACDKLRPTKARAVVGREGIYYLPYEKVLVQHPSLKVGLGNAVIQSVIVNASDEIIGFDLYDSVTLSPQENYSIVIQCVSDTYCTPLTLAIVSPEGTEENQQKTIWLASPLPLDSAVIPHAGDIMSYGYSRDLSTVTREFVIAAIEPSGNAGYILTLVDYNAGIFDVDESTIPEYSPVITQPHSFINEIPAKVPEKHPTYEDLQKVENKYRIFQFAISDSKDEYPEDDSDWQESQPESSDGQFVWMRSRWADESDDWSYSVITGPQGEPGEPGEPGKDGGTLAVYANQSALTFHIDSLGGVEGTEVFIPIHASLNEEEVSFRIKCPADTGGVTVKEYQTENSHGIKISTTKNSRISGGCFTVIVYSNNEESCQFSHALVFSYSVSNESVYRGAKSEIDEFLNPDYEGILVFGDWFTWTGGKTTETYSGVKVTFKTGKVYKWDSDLWVEDNDQNHLMTALSDILTVTKENLEANNSRMIELLDRLTENKAYLEKLGNDELCKILAANEILAQTLVTNETFTGELSAEKTFTDSLVANSVFTEALAANSAFLNQLVSTQVFTQALETSGEAYFGESKKYTDSVTEDIGKTVENYAAAASTSATNAASSASSASTSATNAEKSATAAATSESNASKSATSAKSSADTASTKASAASTSATNAASSASSASTSATNAGKSATAAATSESNASKSATSAKSSADTASTKASAASTSATNAASSASSASTSATAAANSAASAKTTADNIEKNYVKKSDAMAAYETVYFRTNNGTLAVPGKPTANTSIQTTDVADKWTTAATSKTYTFTYVCYRYKAKATDTSYTYTNVSCEAAALIKNGKIITNLLDVDTLFSNEIILKPNGNQLNKYGDANSFRSEQYSYTPYSPIGTSIIGDIRGFRLATLKVNSAFLGMFVCTFMRGDEIAANTVRAGGINIEEQATDSYGTYDKSATSFSPAGGFATVERTSAIATPVKVFAVERRTEQIGSTSHDSMHLLSPKDFIFANKDSSLPGIFLKFLSGSSTKYEQQGIVEHSFGTSFGYIKWANGLIINWGKAADAATVYFGCSYISSAVVVIARVADSSADASNASSSVQPLSPETGSTIKTGFKPHFGAVQNSGHWIAIGY